MGLTIRDHNGKPVIHGRQRLSTGVRLHYYTAGSGPALMLQHGVRESLLPVAFLFPPPTPLEAAEIQKRKTQEG